MKPRILGVDIETFPAIVYTWQLFDVTISLDQIVEPGRIACWGAKWFGSREVMYMDERKGKAKMFDGIHKLLSQADAVVSYNGDHFDIPKLDGAFIEHGLPPTPPVTSIDLFKTVKKLGYQSTKLAFIAPHLKIGEKVKHEGFGLWRACMDGDKAAWERMRKYNLQDVNLLESLYGVLKPHIRNHPHVGDQAGCPACQSTEATSRGYRRTKTMLIQRLACDNCGSWFDGVRKRV